MGSDSSKDGYIEMLVQTNLPYYTAGDYVDGTVFINCKDMRNYRELRIKLDGVEHVQWSQGSGKHRRHYSNTKKTYSTFFQLTIFADGVIKGGHYAFPFKFLLSAQLPGSMFQSDSYYIRYPLTAQLISSDETNENQLYSKYLNVLQPIRSPLGMISKQQITNPQCCGCCADYGMVKITMNCDKNFVRTGDHVQISGVIDNTAGKDKIKNCKIVFQDIRWKISSGGVVRKQTLSQNIFHIVPDIIQQGQALKFSCPATIPGGLIYSTSIGSILSRYQVLKFTGQIGCCAHYPVCEFPLVFHSGTQKIQISHKALPPPGWNPLVVKQVFCTTLSPFNYQPNVGIPFLNRAGLSNITQLNYMSTQGGYNDQVTMGNLN